MRKFVDKWLLVAIVAIALFHSQTVRAEDPPPYLLQWGSQGFGDGQFDGLKGLDIDISGHVFVTEAINHRISKFTRGGTFLSKWGSYGTGDGQFRNPIGVSVDAAGNVFVADNANHRVQKFTNDGVFLTKWGSNGTGDGQFKNPADVTVDAAGNVFVVDDNNDRIQKFTNDGVFLTKWGSNGFGNGQFTNPIDAAVDASGNVYVVDDIQRIQKFTNDGTYLTSFYQGVDWPFVEPKSVDVDAGGNIYVVERYFHTIHKLTRDGIGLVVWGEPGAGPGQFHEPRGVAIDPGRLNVYVVDGANYRIQAFDQEILLGVGPGVAGGQLTLAQPMPNPWSDQTVLRFAIAREDRVALGVFDLQGRQLKQWRWSMLAAGLHQVTWDGRTDDGRTTAAGILFCRLETGGQVLKQKLIHLQ